MLKAIQMLNSSSSSSSSSVGLLLLSQRLKLINNRGCLSLSFSSSSSSTSKRKALLSLTSFGFNKVFSAHSSGSSSNPDLSLSSSSSSVASFISTGISRKIKFCQLCGGQTKHEIPDGEEKMRAVCTLCGRIAYENPKMVVGCLIEHDNKILLCKRNIQPSFGLWTLPAGYMEVGESAAEGAIRETIEEAGADVEVLSPFAHLDIPLIGQTYIIFLARMKKPHFSPGPESSECRLFSFDDIPFDSLAFSSMLVSLKLYIEDRKAGRSKFHYGTINKRPGTSPSDIHAYTLDDHLHSDKTW